jgi:nucleoside-diphosphate-sugar epimerase
MIVAVLGSGAVGRETAKILAARGDVARLVQRHAPAGLPEGAQFAAADALDRDSLRGACRGASALICCIGFRYDSRVWEASWPRAMANMLDVCAEQGARFVFADNLYMYGPQNQPLTEDLPLTNYGRKPRLRAAITRQWIVAHRGGRVEAVAVRASDFYGPEVGTSVLSEYGVKRLVAGKPALVPYSPEHPHDFTYVPDFARALVALLDAPSDAYGQAWHSPNAPTKTLRQLLARSAELIGVAPRMTVLPRAVVALLGLFDRTIYELAEMRFQSDRPYLVDSSKFAGRFALAPTPFDEGMRATIAACRGAG